MALLVGLFQAPASAQAVTAAGFDPGNIISDSLFYNGNAMSTVEVQSFLDTRVPRCTIGDPGRTAGMPWGNTHIAAWCLKNFSQTTVSKAADSYCGTYVGLPNESASQIIAKVGQACGISQRVLLVMLEKEQSLVTDSFPTVRQLDVAMGANCPDSGPNWSANCDPRFYGFQNQVYRAAWLLKYYLLNPLQYQYRANQWNTIQWNPNPSCGTSQVFIENSATAALYIYTPYRPNQAALNAGWGLGDSCSSYGNRNFYLLYTTWFGTAQAINHASLDSATGEYGGIRVSGWARKLTDPGTAYVWANVYNGAGELVLGQAIAANQSLNWFNGYFPGWGNNHGFALLLNVAPGTYTIRLYNSSVNSELFDARSVTVPVGQGYVDSVSQTVGGIRIQGWSVDFRTTSPDQVRVVVNGVEHPQLFSADRPTSWVNAMFPGMGNDHGFDFVVPSALGAKTVCVYGAAGLLRPCVTITLQTKEQGNLDAITLAEGGVLLTGWAVNLATPEPSAITITVNGSRHEVIADRPLGWFNGYFPGAGPNHGFEAIVPIASSGIYEFCIVGQATNVKLHCKTQRVLAGENTSFDSATASVGKIRITGWSAIFGNTNPSFIWVNVNGAGGPYRADRPLSWFDSYAPGSGPNHGFDITIPAAPGTHQVCVYGAATGVSAGCKVVTVPSPVEQGHLDGVSGGTGAIRAWGWSHIPGQHTPSFVWVDVDGSGAAYPANGALGWFDAYFPGQGNNHGFDITIPAAPGTHRVCVYGSSGPTALGCQVVTVQ